MVKRTTDYFIFSLLPISIFILLFPGKNTLTAILISAGFLIICFLSGRIHTALNAGKQCLWCGKELLEQTEGTNISFAVCSKKHMEGMLKFASFIQRRKALIASLIFILILLFIATLLSEDSDKIHTISVFLLRFLCGSFLIVISSLHNKEQPLDQKDFPKALRTISTLCPPGINVSLWTLKVCGVLILIIESDLALPAVSKLLVNLF